VPLCFMCAVTFSAGYLKIFSVDPKIGFLSGAAALFQNAGAVSADKAAQLTRQAAVWRFDALVAFGFLVLVLLIVLGSAKHWWQLMHGTRRIELHESEFVPLAQLESAPVIGD